MSLAEVLLAGLFVTAAALAVAFYWRWRGAERRSANPEAPLRVVVPTAVPDGVALRESESRFRTLIEDLDVGVVMQDAQDRILVSNPAAARLLGLTQEQLLGVTAMDPRWSLMREDGSPFPADEVPSVMAARTLQPVRNAVIGTVNLQTGSRTLFEVNATPRLRADGTLLHVLVTLVDVTERRLADERRRALERQLAEAQKMEAVGRLAGGVAHDFNNLLTVISGYSETLRASVPSDGNAAMLAGIQDAADRAASLTRQLLAFSRRQVVEARVVDLNVLVKEAEQILERVIGEDVRMVRVSDEGTPRVRVDPGQFGQVILNLAVNARDAMPTGGTLTIRTGREELDADAVRGHHSAAAGTFAVLEVADTGCGMSADIQSHIFEPFFTTKGVGKGTGLGLASVAAIVEQCAGFVTVSSKPDVGTTFKVYLPGVDGDTESGPAENLQAIEPRGRETILLAEDEPVVRSVVKQMLEQVGYTVIEASSGPEALRIAGEHGGPIDLLVSDVVMPEIGGRKLVEQLRLIRPRIGVVYVSGYTDDAVVRHGVLHSEVMFLQKPFSRQALARKVREAMDAGAARAPMGGGTRGGGTVAV